MGDIQSNDNGILLCILLLPIAGMAGFKDALQVQHAVRRL